MINVVVIMWQGLIEDVKAFKEEAAAFRFFELETQTSWEEYKKRRDTEANETILGDCAGSMIYEVKIE